MSTLIQTCLANSPLTKEPICLSNGASLVAEPMDVPLDKTAPESTTEEATPTSKMDIQTSGKYY